MSTSKLPYISASLLLFLSFSIFSRPEGIQRTENPDGTFTLSLSGTITDDNTPFKATLTQGTDGWYDLTYSENNQCIHTFCNQSIASYEFYGIKQKIQDAYIKLAKKHNELTLEN